MGFIYFTKGKYPAFLTINKLNAVLKELERLGLYDPNNTFELFGGKEVNAVNKTIIGYLKRLEKVDITSYLELFYEFECEGKEAKDNLFALLDSAACVHKFFGFQQTESSMFDVRFPMGQRYTYVISRSRKGDVLLDIDTDELIAFKGNLNCFVILFRTYWVIVDHGSIRIHIISENDSMEKNNNKEISVLDFWE